MRNPNWKPQYSVWRHGGWYVTNVQHASGASGCVSNNYPDNKWRIVCDSRRNELGQPGDFTFPSRDAAAKAEYEIAKKEASRYLVSPGWGHIFSGEREETTRWIYDSEAENLVAAQVLDGTNQRVWRDLDPTSTADLLRDINDNDAVDSPSEWGLMKFGRLPSWEQIEEISEQQSNQDRPVQRG